MIDMSAPVRRAQRRRAEVLVIPASTSSEGGRFHVGSARVMCDQTAARASTPPRCSAAGSGSDSHFLLSYSHYASSEGPSPGPKVTRSGHQRIARRPGGHLRTVEGKERAPRSQSPERVGAPGMQLIRAVRLANCHVGNCANTKPVPCLRSRLVEVGFAEVAAASGRGSARPPIQRTCAHPPPFACFSWPPSLWGTPLWLLDPPPRSMA